MSEVSSWNEIDNSNNAAPPDGWPEFMNPSDVNNCARAMMGALKRWYNTVSAGIANALPLSGGTLTGPLVAPQITSTGALTAVNATINGTLGVLGGASVAGAINAASLSATGTVNAANMTTGTLSVSTNAVIGDDLTVETVHAVELSATDTVNAANMTTGTLSASSNVAVAGNITANNITANALVNTVTYLLSGANFATRGTDGAGTANVIFDTGAPNIAIPGDTLPPAPAILLYGGAGSYYRAGNAHNFTDRAASFNICRFQATDGNCINISGLWNVVSDRAVKENVAPYRAGLAEVLQLEPVSYRYTDDAPFGADGQLRYGLVAQDVEPILPEMITHAALSRAGSDETADYATMAPGHLVFVLVNSVKELAVKNAALEARLTQLEAGG